MSLPPPGAPFLMPLSMPSLLPTQSATVQLSPADEHKTRPSGQTPLVAGRLHSVVNSTARSGRQHFRDMHSSIGD
ncbi:unnamed protein product [Protopolystoma xenopodis]|uniref:Uncharacterized protein n=1 Tax=Protopolystoma xenopodis TaxID=117903 RepID=A0A3S5B434_9PLAT|nr:unnamed protein product [Protopolystoma xenopodis]